VSPETGQEVRFADTPPSASREGDVTPRPQFATHMQVLAALAAERIDWLSYQVTYRAKGGGLVVRQGLTLDNATKMQAKALQEGNTQVLLDRTITCAGWPQLPYEELKKLGDLPPTPEAELKKIVDHELRRAALRIRREVDAERAKELATLGAE
jgi:hypothetical protein